MRKQITQGHVQHPFLQPAAQWRLERDRHRSRRGSKQRNAFVRFLKIADGSNAETQALTLIAGDAGIFETQQVHEILSLTNEIGRMLNGLMRRHSG
jgi:hypothetical protein